ncbi:MAG: Fe-S cluster assembly protein SufD [Candidatus Omnitrophota bacterium]|nr:Fe-S cluster assembly protein SufD [Candidatus Omnitrophota bacterium]
MLMVEDVRKTAWERYESLPWPVRTDEEWRRTDPKLLPALPAGEKPKEGAFQTGWETPAPELIRSGVILTDLATATKQFPDLVQEYLFQTGEPGQLKKFVALHQAVAQQGLFCYVPDGVKVELPLRSWIEAISGPAIFPHLAIVVGKDSELTLVDERRSAPGAAEPVLSNEMAEIFVGAGGRLRYVHLQRWNSATTELFTQRAILEKEAQFLNITVGLGSKLSKANVETLLRGPGAHADLLGIFFGAGKQHFDFHTLQDHQAPNTFSDLLYKCALADQAELVYTGLIRIAKQAQKSNAYQANRNLLLSQGAKADSIPMLEIEADDVRCTHGVAVGPVDEEQAFYLMSRGLSATESERLIVEGFFEQILKRIPVGDLREQLAEEIVTRLSTHTETGKETLT